MPLEVGVGVAVDSLDIDWDWAMDWGGSRGDGERAMVKPPPRNLRTPFMGLRYGYVREKSVCGTWSRVARERRGLAAGCLQERTSCEKDSGGRCWKEEKEQFRHNPPPPSGPSPVSSP